MRPTLKPDGILEHVALWANLGPVPVAEAMFGMAVSRVLMAGVRLGLFGELSRASLTAQEAALRCGLDAAGAGHLLDCLVAMGHVRRSGGRYATTRRAAKWLDPISPTYIGDFLEFNYDQWDWWSGLEEVVKTGHGYDIHAYGPDDPRWRRYITAMFQLARLSAPEVAKALKLTPNPSSVLDLAGGHGWFAAELCKRHPGMSATVMELPPSAAVGREIIAQNGMSDRVRYVEGDILASDYGGPHDAILAFQIIHHLTPEQNQTILRKANAALKPGGVLAVLDYFTPPADKPPDSAAFLGLHFYLTSSAATYSIEEVKGWLREAGFSTIRRARILRIPVQVMLEARLSATCRTSSTADRDSVV